MNTIHDRGLVPYEQPQALELHRAPKLGVGLVTEDQFRIMWGIAKTVGKGGSNGPSAGMVPDAIKTPEAAMAVMLAGHELGFPPFSAFRLIFPVNGKMQLMTEGYVALVKQRDPTARFIFHEITDEGADVELIRNGVSQIRVRYTESERLRAHQGYTQDGDWEDYDWYDREKKATVKRRRKTVKKDADGNAIWLEDTSSPWYTHRADMFAWAATKRCVRFGAPDLVNLAPQDMVVVPEDAIEEPALGPVVYGGSHLSAFADDDEGPADGGDWTNETPPAPMEHEATQQAPGSASDGTAAVAATTPAASSVDDEPGVTDVPMDLATTRQTLEALLTDCKDTWGAQDFAALQAEMGQFNPDGKGIFNPRSVPESKASEALAFLRTKRGDA